MAVFTNFSDDDFRIILANYDIGKFVEAKGIAEGIENTNYKLITSKNKFIFTIYEKRVNPQDLPFYMNLQKILNEMGFCCPQPISNAEGSFISKYKNKFFTIVSFLDGAWPKEITNNNIVEASRILAKLHLTTKNISENTLFRKNSLSKDYWVETYNKVKIQAEEKFVGLEILAKKGFEAVSKLPNNLPNGIIHGDFFPDNVLFSNDNVSGVIDFYMACNDDFIYDLAIALNAWCSDENKNYCQNKAKIFIEKYIEIRSLSEAELSSLKYYLVASSLRFMSSRLYDFFNIPEGAIVSQKDPKEYINKLDFHLKNI